MGTFRIGPVLQMVAWLVAALVIVINGYLLLDFFSSEVNGVFVQHFCVWVYSCVRCIYSLPCFPGCYFFKLVADDPRV
ncbi:hypothetical protein SLA2020_279900 [Shorea laevis]